jgi:hypothetical protein
MSRAAQFHGGGKEVLDALIALSPIGGGFSCDGVIVNVQDTIAKM